MEHRWGTRWPVDIPLMVDLGRGILERGFILNISASGLLVRMAAGLKLPLHTPLTILYLEGGPGRHRVHHLEATVVRHSAAGTGLMYPDFNPLLRSTSPLMSYVRAAYRRPQNETALR